MPDENEPTTAKCHFCESEGEAEDMLCYGCKAHVCTDCNTSFPYGNHSVEDHQDPDIDGF